MHLNYFWVVQLPYHNFKRCNTTQKLLNMEKIDKEIALVDSNNYNIHHNKTNPIFIKHEANVCCPLKNLPDIWGYLANPPEWIKDIKPLSQSSNSVIHNNDINCHDNRLTVQKRVDSLLIPKTLVCHDMKNGYLHDKNTVPIDNGNGYTFYRWSQIDVFVYFSHHFVTIPPLAWINLAHLSGVKILGTLITENDEGINLCKSIFKSQECMKLFADALIDLTILYEIDGWLINIENPIDDTSILIDFLKYLTNELHIKVANSTVIWYDSVITDGTLNWQNELNEKNRPFFDVCDGIYLNYTWTLKKLDTTVDFAEHRLFDVYVGIDVFGRNTFGGGQFDTHIAAKEIRERNLSMAIFAPGWTHETLDLEPNETFFERFLIRDNQFWQTLWPFLYTKPINQLFETNFYTGADAKKYDLNLQKLQPHLLSNKISAELQKDNQCTCCQFNFNNDRIYYSLNSQTLINKCNINLFTCNIDLKEDILLYYIIKSDNGECNTFDINVLIQENTSFRKFICTTNKIEDVGNNFTNVYIKHKNDGVLKIKNLPEDVILKYFHIPIQVACKLLQISFFAQNPIDLYGFGLKLFADIQ